MVFGFLPRLQAGFIVSRYVACRKTNFGKQKQTIKSSARQLLELAAAVPKRMDSTEGILTVLQGFHDNVGEMQVAFIRKGKFGAEKRAEQF